MKEVKTDKYTFTGSTAQKAADYYLRDLSEWESDDKDNLAFEAAHECGCKVSAPEMAMFFGGLIYGERAQEAATSINNSYKRMTREIMNPSENELAFYSMVLATCNQYNVRYVKLL